MLDISFNFFDKIISNLFPFYKDKELRFVFKKLQEDFSKEIVAARFVGGCVRKYLSNEKLIDFISTNILAISFDIFLSYLCNMFK